MPAFSLEDLQQQITQRELELQTLRQELETRQNELTTLASRKEDLQTQLRQVEAELAALAASSPPEPATTLTPTAVVPPPSPPPAQAQPRLADLIVTMLRHAGKAMTSRQLRDEALRRGFQTSSPNLVKTIEVRIQDLKKKGLVRKAADQPGYLLGSSAQGGKAGTTKKTPQLTPGKTKKTAPQAVRPAKPASAAKKASRPSATNAGSAKATGPVQREPQPPLREVLTTLLKKSNQPLSSSELAARVLAGGYQTNSANFVKVVGNKLGEMDNVDYLPGKGYRLKKTKAKT